MLNTQYKNKQGLGLLEVVIAIGMIVLFFGVITSVTYSLRVFQENKFKIAASYIAQSSVDKIRSLPFDLLTPRTDAPLTGITFNLGQWKTEQDANAPSSPNILRLSKHASETGGATALITTPASNVENGNFEAKIKLNSSSVTSFAGLFFRSQDNHSYYRFIFNEEEIKFEKVVAGVPEALWQQSQVFSSSTYYKLEASLASDSITLLLNDWELTTVVDATFEKGDLGIIVIGSDLFPSIDDVSVISGLTFNWNFDSTTLPELPMTWQRHSLYDLPQAQGLLTIEDISDNLKKTIIQIKWVTHFGEKTIETQTYITSY